MKQNETIFMCANCDAQYTKWIGRCLECGKWGTLTQETVIKKKSGATTQSTAKKPTAVGDVSLEKQGRIETPLAEWNRVLGGGMVPGSFILLGGEPGIGKSTLSLQIAVSVNKTLYISGEESIGQIKMRADRLTKKNTALQLLNETHVETIIATLEAESPTLAIIDSIQTMYSDEALGAPGSVNQVRTCATKFLSAAKATNTTILLIGHVTKDGSVAGPRTLEHLVDTVLYLEGERYHTLRMLRTIKNRFGSTDEMGMFDMQETGLVEVANASALLLEERGESIPGSVVTCMMEGTRPLLVEVQALVNKTSFGYPVRKASGFDVNRLHVLLAVLEKRAGLQLGQYDVHINMVGGIRVEEPAADLAVCLAVASAYKEKTLGNDLAVFGEVGLGGEIRSVRFLEKRLKECSALGMKRVITKSPKGAKAQKNITVLPVTHIQDLIKHT